MNISPWASGVMKVAMFSAAFAVPGTGMAMAAGPVPITSGGGSILGGNQVNLPVSAPIDVCGNGVGVLGFAAAGCAGGASVSNAGGSGGWGHAGGSGGAERTSGGGERTSGTGSVLGGNQVNAPISLPVDVCGNSVAVIGGAVSGCRGGASVGSGGNGSGGRTAAAGTAAAAPTTARACPPVRGPAARARRSAGAPAVRASSGPRAMGRSWAVTR